MRGAGMGNGIAGLLYHAPGDTDPYITLKDDPEDDEVDDFRIKPQDNLLICGQTEDVYSHLEVNGKSMPHSVLKIASAFTPQRYPSQHGGRRLS